MIEEQHPNLHTVGLLVDVSIAVRGRVRGDAAHLHAEADASLCILREIMQFTKRIEEILDAHTAELRKKA